MINGTLSHVEVDVIQALGGVTLVHATRPSVSSPSDIAASI
jgi:hypothetical protein